LALLLAEHTKHFPVQPPVIPGYNTMDFPSDLKPGKAKMLARMKMLWIGLLHPQRNTIIPPWPGGCEDYIPRDDDDDMGDDMDLAFVLSLDPEELYEILVHNHGERQEWKELLKIGIGGKDFVDLSLDMLMNSQVCT
jgi:hypothetical protein